MEFAASPAAPDVPADLRRLARAQQQRAETEIHGEGMPATRWHRILAGTVRLGMMTFDGRRSIVALLSVGDVFGLEPHGRVHGTAAEAVSPVTLETYTLMEALQLAEENGEVERFLHGVAAARCAFLHARILELSCLSATERLARYLLSLWQRGGGGRRLVLPVSRRDLADHLGTRPETMSRVLSQLRQEGVIGHERLDVVTLLSPERLREVAEAGRRRQAQRFGPVVAAAPVALLPPVRPRAVHRPRSAGAG